MKKTFIKVMAVLFVLVMTLPMTISAASYQTYTYSIDGELLASPDAYTPYIRVDSSYMGLPEGEVMKTPTDLVVDENGKIYIADSGNNCIYVLTSDYHFDFKITTFVNSHGVRDSLSGCAGCYVANDRIYVADTNNSRIVIFDMKGNYVRHLEEPKSDIFEDNALYKPTALAVDAAERIYVLSSTTYQGIISLDQHGNFQGFVGAQQVSYTMWDIFWRQFQTAAQRAKSVKTLPMMYNNITIDKTGFIYCTIYDPQNESAQQSAVSQKTAAYAPVKKFNASGKDILSRNGFFGPGGEVKTLTRVYSSSESENVPVGASKIVDVALGPAGSWSIIDSKRSKIYTYDQYGQLLFIFGDRGKMLGNIEETKAITYQGTNILILDSKTNSLTVYTRTEYGDILINALQNEIDRNYGAAVDDYTDILTRNSNFDAAYIGIGKALYRQGDYEGAMEKFSAAYETSNYSKAFKEIRQLWANKYFIVIPIVIVVLLFAVTKFFGYAGKVNKATSLKKGPKTFKEEVLYAFHLIFHPFDGYWDLKHEKRGSVRAATFYLVIAVITICYQAVGRAYIFNPRASYENMFITAISLLVPLILWVAGNWCLTTLFDGEGSLKDIYVATCYALIPLILLIIPATALTNVLTLGEATIYNMLTSVAWVWTGLLLFFGTMVTHDYSLGKNIITCVGSIVAMAFIMFCGVLFSSLLMQMINFISGIVTEISYRM